MKSQHTYEPAERDPVAIRRTVIILILLMLVGGFFIVYKYKEKMADEHEETLKGRPVMSLGSVSAKTNFQVKSSTGEVVDFTLLEGKLSLMAVISVNLPEQSELIVNEMKKAQEHFSEKEPLQLICISADTLKNVPMEQLAEFAKKAGAEGESWHVLASDSEEFSGYVKNVLKLGMTSRVDKETNEKILPDFLRIVDHSTRIRGGIADFTFVEYHEDKAKAKSIMESDDASEVDKKQAQEVFDNIISYQRERMYKNIEYILSYENTDVAALKEVNRSNRYFFPLMIFSGFILFILIMGYRLKIQRRKEALANDGAKQTPNKK